MKRTAALLSTFVLTMILISGCAQSSESNETEIAMQNASAEPDSESVVYELRTYTTYEGKLDDLHARFENHTMDLFEKHGMTNIMYWTPQDPELSENTLIYLLSHESRESAEQSWEGFSNDEEWHRVYEASRTDGPIVERVESVYMTKTPYSP